MRLQSALEAAVERILEARRRLPPSRAALIAVSGIDACGKGYLTAKLAGLLQASSIRVANINIDGWLNLPHVRFSKVNPAEHFYRHAIRFDAMFEQLIFPLRNCRAIDLTMDYTEEIAASYHKHRVKYEDIDIILVEGIYLLKREFQAAYDLALWIDCSFETALERAIGRAQEGLTPDATIKAYETIYFPAQQIHFAIDDPKAAAQLTIRNDCKVDP